VADLISRAQLDKLGDRLRAGSRVEADLRALDDFRHSFRPAFDAVMESLKNLRLEKTGRMKTVGAIVDKLNRQRIRLTQIQDIAGVRLTCADAPDQDLLTNYLIYSFPGSVIDDRRKNPSHGYRAVHVIVTSKFDRMVEIQLRTQAQHRWAQVSEKLADKLGMSIKYGGGPKWASDALMDYSETVKEVESLEHQHHKMLHDASDLRQKTSDAPTAAERERLILFAEELETRIREQRPAIERELERIAALVASRDHEANDDLPD
jgi:ppGpp synthetase/RelA/SpoT-type nucleotidyltranferase